MKTRIRRKDGIVQRYNTGRSQRRSLGNKEAYYGTIINNLRTQNNLIKTKIDKFREERDMTTDFASKVNYNFAIAKLKNKVIANQAEVDRLATLLRTIRGDP